MDEKKYAILAISESWPNSNVKNDEVDTVCQYWTGREIQ